MCDHLRNLIEHKLVRHVIADAQNKVGWISVHAHLLQQVLDDFPLAKTVRSHFDVIFALDNIQWPALCSS